MTITDPDQIIGPAERVDGDRDGVTDVDGNDLAGEPGGTPRGSRSADIGRRPRLAWRQPSRSGWITAAIAALSAVLYTWSLSSVGDANSYYTAAVKSATVSWKAFFFGSIDPGNFITVDKPPAALWLQALSGRLFGFSSFSMLLPEALAGVASVLILHRLVRKWAGDTAAHLAALAFALTPVAVLMFRYNNPDALLTFLCLAAAWALWSAVETGRTRMLVLSAALVGLAFNTKMLQAFLVVPAFIVVYLFAGKPKLGKRIGQLAIGLVTLIVSSGWWVAIVALWPASARPYIGSTTDNSILSLVFGYNGLSRIFGGSGGPAAGAGGAGAGPGGVGGGGGFGGSSGLFRMFNLANGGQISWLLPLALVGLVGGLWLTRRNARTDLARAGWLLWGGWALVCLAVFSLSSGIFHQYYSVQLAPAIAALAGAGSVALWKLGNRQRWLRFVLPAAVVVTAGWAVILLDRTPDYHPWLRPVIVIGAALAAAGLWLGWHLRQRVVVLVAAGIAAVTLLAGPAAYALTTVRGAQSGSIVSAGPATSATGVGGAGGGFGGSTATDTTLIAYLEAHRANAKYLVATFGSQSSASIIIATGQPVMTIGGFNGSDPAPTLAQFEALVARGEVRYVLVAGNAGGGPNGGAGGAASSQSISSWVTTHGKEVQLANSTTAGGGTLYDVSGAA